MDTARKTGLFDERLPRKQNREWLLRALQFGNLEYLPREFWHFEFHEPDQMKSIASMKYRILVDLKNGFDPAHNMRIAVNSAHGRWAMAEAFRAFFTDPVWDKESHEGVTIRNMDQIKKISDEEASEKWKEE